MCLHVIQFIDFNLCICKFVMIYCFFTHTLKLFIKTNVKYL